MRVAVAEPTPSAQTLATKGRALTIAGSLVIALGAALTIAAPLYLNSRATPDTPGCDPCLGGLDGLNGTIGLAVSGTVAFGIGVPLLAYGIDDLRRSNKARLTSMAVHIDNGGATISLAGRF
jgi:hypothetical protein